MINDDTICAVSTPSGVGGIAVIRLSGQQSKQLSERYLRSLSGKRISLCDRKAMYASVVSEEGGFIDDVVATYFKSPRSYTGDDVVELSCHISGSGWRWKVLPDLPCGVPGRSAFHEPRSVFLRR